MRSAHHFQGMATQHSVEHLYAGRFAEMFDKHMPLDPTHDMHHIRLRVYNVSSFGELALNAPGDFVAAGISWGIAPRVLFDYARLAKNGRALHMVDAFTGIDNAKNQSVMPKYNTSKEYVARQYPPVGAVHIHTGLIPACLPLPGLTRIAFCHLNTGDHDSEAASLSHFFDALSPGGIIVIDNYAIFEGSEHRYKEAIESLQEKTVMVLPTGQCAIIKNHQPLL